MSRGWRISTPDLEFHNSRLGAAQLCSPQIFLSGRNRWQVYRRGKSLHYSPTDLTVFFNSEFASWMDRWYAEQGGRAAENLTAPHAGLGSCSPDEKDGELQLVARKG